MNVADISIKRPVFVTCIFILILILGYLALRRLPVDLFPDVTYPIITVNTAYPGAAPSEIETLISKPIEDEISTLSGIKTLSSINREGISTVIAEFTLKSDIKDVEQQIRNHVDIIRNKLPSDIKEPVIFRIDPSSQPILQIALSAKVSEGELFDLADDIVAPQIQQVPQVGLVEILGGRKREVQVQLDLKKLTDYKISATQVSQKIAGTGKNIPIGKINEAKEERVFRLIGEHPSIKSIEDTIVTFTGNERPIKVSDLGKVVDTLEDEKNRTFLNGNKTLVMEIFKQSKSNTVAVAEGIKKRVTQINEELSKKYPEFNLRIVQDSSKSIHDNVDDVKDSILIGIGLTVIVVLFFLGNFRSTIITGLSLPNSLLGAFVLMLWAGFSLNMMSLLALSLAVGLLIDDAIVVRENIFRHIELGEKPMEAARKGTSEVLLAVVATTFTVLAVFGPIGFLQGLVGQFFKEFGLTICFAMLISLFDALTMAPMLSAYFAGSHVRSKKPFFLLRPIYFLLDLFDRFQNGLERAYEFSLKKILRWPFLSLTISFLVFVVCVASVAFIPKTFLPPQDFGEFVVLIETSPGTSLDAMNQKADEVLHVIQKNSEVQNTVLTVGDKDGQSNIASFYIQLVPRKKRSMNTTQFKDKLREQLKTFQDVAPKVTDYDRVGQGQRPFNLYLKGNDLEQLEKFSQLVFEKLRKHPALQDVETSHKPGKPEVQLLIDKKAVEDFGISSDLVGQEIRTHIEGAVPAVYREQGKEYDIRVRLQESQRHLKENFSQVLVPNINYTMVPLRLFSSLKEETSPVSINRENRSRYINVAGDITPGSVGLGGLITDINKMFTSELKPPPGISYKYVGQAENFQELIENMIIALALGVVFIYFVLASLYESFITPLTIMLVLPLAACGAFVALFVTQHSLDIYSIIGCILLMGVATKNSILLVDYTNQLKAEGLSRIDSLVKAGRTRLRPILMTSIALIAGMVPVAIGLNEASQQRVSMGISVIGGVISSTLLTLIVIPAAYIYIDRFNDWVKKVFRKLSKSEAH